MSLQPTCTRSPQLGRQFPDCIIKPQPSIHLHPTTNNTQHPPLPSTSHLQPPLLSLFPLRPRALVSFSHLLFTHPALYPVRPPATDIPIDRPRAPHRGRNPIFTMSWKLTKSTSTLDRALLRGPSSCPPCHPLHCARDTTVDKSPAAELKETHLGPLSNTFSRSPSSATVTEKDDKSQGSISGTATPTNESTIGMPLFLSSLSLPHAAPPALGLPPPHLRRPLLTKWSLPSCLGSALPSARRQGPEARNPGRHPPRGPELFAPRAAPKCLHTLPRRQLPVDG